MAKEGAKVPVVSIALSRLKKMIPNVSEEKIIDMLPFAGLDIEGIDEETIRVEYNPNRPDFSSDYGIIRSLRGIMGIETGLPRIAVKKSDASVSVERGVKSVRPYVFALVARGGKLDDAAVKQLVAMQEDLHEGIGRRRKKASIGLHDLDAIRFPLRYTIVDRDYSFIPLGETNQKSIRVILEESETGRLYSHILAGSEKCPLIVDSSGTVLSLPPIINGSATKVDENTRNLFVEVTATSRSVGQDALAILAVTLHDAGFGIQSVAIRQGKSRLRTPVMTPRKVKTDVSYVNSVLGLELDARQVVKCLQKCRLGAKVRHGIIECEIPRYRTDIAGPIDISEELAIGYGIYKFEPTLPPAMTSGGMSDLSRQFDAIREVLTGTGMLESLNFSLGSAQVLYNSFGRSSHGALSVEGPKSSEHEYLRDSIIPSLLQSLSKNVHEEYPQKLFEIGKVFNDVQSQIAEGWSVAGCIAHASANFTEAKSTLQTLLGSAFGKSAETNPNSDQFFIPGRSAEILVDGIKVGRIGEITPLALENFRLRIPVSAFELDLSRLLRLPQ